MEKARTLPGFMELLPNEQIKFNKLIDIIRTTFEKYGFLPLDTPVLEDTNVLLAKAGGETSKQMYSFKKGDNDISLRFDLTVPLAKYVTLYQNDIVFPFKRYQIGKVYRGEKPQRGRFREFYQCDIDIIGNQSLDLSNDSEVIACICEIFEKLSIGEFVIRLNNRKVLNGYLSSIGVENIEETIRTIDKIDKIGIEKVNQILSDFLDEEQINKIDKLLTFKGSNKEKIEFLEEMLSNINSSALQEGIEELKILLENLTSYKVDKYINIDFSIVRGLDYYTSNVFETNLVNHKEIGSICSGGRYENLVGSYSQNKMPGVGISIGLTRLFYLLNELHLLDNQNNGLIDFMVISQSKEQNSYAIEIAKRVRFAKKNVVLNIDNVKIGKKFKIADKLKIKHVIVLGEEEEKTKTLTIKNMFEGSQKQIKINELYDEIIKIDANKKSF